jgi:magnesium transporter
MFKTYDLVGNVLVANGADSAKIHVYVNPDADERQTILRTTNLDDHSLSSALDPDEISRVEFKPDHTFIIWKRPENYSFQEHVAFNVSSVGLVLMKDRLVIILGEDIGLANGKQAQNVDTVTDIVLNLFSQTTRHFLEHLKVIKQISREVQHKINTALENEYLIQMFSLGESLTYYLNAISSNTVVLTKIRNHVDKIGLSPEQVELLDDIMIENNQCAKQAEIYSSILSGLMDARGTLVNNNMNVILKNLTIINTVFLPLNLIAGIGGMSEFSMMTKGIDWRVTYLLFLVAMVILGWLTTLFIHKFSWWQKKRG